MRFVRCGKSTLSGLVKKRLQDYGIPAEIIDGGDYRKMLCGDLGFSKTHRCENLRRLGFVASKLSAHGIVAIISAINPTTLICISIPSKKEKKPVPGNFSHLLCCIFRLVPTQLILPQER